MLKARDVYLPPPYGCKSFVLNGVLWDNNLALWRSEIKSVPSSSLSTIMVFLFV